MGLEDFRQYCERNQRPCAGLLNGESQGHRELVEAIVQDPSRVGVEGVIAYYLEVKVSQRGGIGPIDLVLFTDRVAYLCEATSSGCGHGGGLASRLRTRGTFVRKQFGIPVEMLTIRRNEEGLKVRRVEFRRKGVSPD